MTHEAACLQKQPKNREGKQHDRHSAGENQQKPVRCHVVGREKQNVKKFKTSAGVECFDALEVVAKIQEDISIEDKT